MPFSFDPTTGRYRDAAGRFVPDQSIRRALDVVLDAQAQTMRLLSQQLMDGTIMLADWQLAMMQATKAVHLVGTAVAHGGWSQLDQSDFGWAGQRIRTQYSYLNRFAADIASGRQNLDGTLLARSELYAQAGRATHRAAERRLATKRGLAEEKNLLGAADHCAGCLAETARGWVKIGTLVPCGSRDCLVRCHCSLTYRTVQAA